MTDQFIRPYRTGDDVSTICLRTGASGQDATGVHTDPRLLGDVFVVPYVVRHPDLAWVIDDGAGRAIGYVVGTPDTDAFEAWFRDEWWPAIAGRYAGGERDADRSLTSYAASRGSEPVDLAAAFPAHLHIDLLPEAQGAGWGRRLIGVLCDALADRGVPAVHLVASVDNAGALAFYPRVGFTPASDAADNAAFVRTL